VGLNNSYLLRLEIHRTMKGNEVMKKKYLGLMIASAMLAGSVTAFAAEENAVQSAAGGQKSTLNEYTLEDVMVTATRSEKRDVEVPAATIIISADQIKESGASNALDALAKSNSVTYKSFGALGINMGTMSNDVVIRGVDNGTLILVNGSPVSWRGKYNLEGIQADTIERIEVVKGGGSVLYGSEAMAGVVNIITKTKADNSITVGVGNRGRQKYALHAGTDDVAVHYIQNRVNFYDGASIGDITSGSPQYGTTRTDIRDIKNGSFGIDWKIDDNFTFRYNHTNTNSTYFRNAIISGTSGAMKAGDLYNWREYETTMNNWQLNYKDDNGWKANLFFNDNLIESYGFSYFSAKGVKYAPTNKSYLYNTREKHMQYGTDIQKNWNVGDKTNFIAGINWKRENYRTLDTAYTKANNTELYNFSRNIWAVFGQWEQKYDAKNSTILGVRETFTTNADKDQNYHNFSASAQYLHKMDKDNNLYVNIAQSFVMPTFSQMYGASWQSIPNPNLKPQRGINYELGWKNDHNAHTWRAAIFHNNIKDNISAKYDKGTNEYTYENEEFRNTGVELSCDIDNGKKWSYNYGITVQDPKAKSAVKPYWDRKFGRLQLTGGISYRYRKFKSNLSGSYLAHRVMAPSKTSSYEAKPYFLTTLELSYAPTDKSEFALTIDNILDRRDNTMHTSSYYYTAPTTFMFSFTQHF